MAKKKKRKQKKSSARRLSLRAGFLLAIIFVIWGSIAEWFVHHPRQWFAQNAIPKFIEAPLFWLGNPLADITDGLGWTGHDTIYEYDTEAPNGEVLFAGAPKRVGNNAPDDIRILNRGDFLVGWSDKLRHPVWCAYHIRREAPYDVGKRPSFTKDKSVPTSPHPNDYTKSGYDRGHMVPNYAIITRYGEESRRKTFMMTNITPQTPQLNRGVWRELEHRIADLWTNKYGELWVIVGCISDGNEKIGATNIDVPTSFYQLIIAQEGMNVRALAVLLNQNVEWDEWAARHIVTIDELEELTGLDFNPDLPSFIQDPLEADLPSRLWPVNVLDIVKQVLIRFKK